MPAIVWDIVRMPICYQCTPTTLKLFVEQRERWARGMIEAFIRTSHHFNQTKIIHVFYFTWNLVFPWLRYYVYLWL